ncbi:AbrB family transcriptional regulator [Aurantimonas sp. VKM B-3413]|uniref:AbrB family transcriptional regulator n=1 Tax=Aurantimonas sp. VKM B-3413 TaxID=2779401 RepID=UPI001E646D90|nr:AbrB family transcriptional regulator [Aurantimonas sp. VKM B-3413]
MRRWLALLLLSAAVGGLLELAGIPAALLLGPMAAGIVLAVTGNAVTISNTPYNLAQGAIGCLIAAAITPSILSTFLEDWPLYIAIVVVVIAASSLLGFLMSRWQVLPGTTAVWGSSPGAATAMMLMAEAFGADARLVAFMQYLRVIFVAVAASLMARFWIGAEGSMTSDIMWFPAINWPAFGATLALTIGGATLGTVLRIPAGPLLVPMGIGIVLHLLGVTDFQLPEWFLVIAYALLGWRIGLGFTAEVMGHAWHALPKIVASILVLLAFCGGLAALLNLFLGIDPVTAYLATSPGGMDSIAIIAASTKVDLPFVMALQTVRFLIVLVAGPPIARFIATRIGETSPDAARRE